tara:strand:+ start:3357 stop:4319 length:963 start_codon:yes stop_codon:yes gene_type:complete
MLRTRLSHRDPNLSFQAKPQDARMRKQQMGDVLQLDDPPYIIQSLAPLPGKEPSLYYQMLEKGKLLRDPHFQLRPIEEDLSGERVLEKIPLDYKERQVKSIVDSLKTLASNVDGFRGGISGDLQRALNIELKPNELSLIDSLSKDDQKHMLDDVQNSILKRKYDDKINIDDILSRIKKEGDTNVYDHSEPEEKKSEIDKFIADEPPGDEKEEEEFDLSDLSKPVPGEPEFEEKEEKKHDIPGPPPPSASDIENIYGTYPGGQFYRNAIDDELSEGNEIIGVKPGPEGSRPVFVGPQGGQFTFTASGRKSYIRLQRARSVP